MDHADVVVIGAGIAGSATARALGRRGIETILLEQFEVGHARGSSHGPTRLFRLAYPQPDYVRLAQRAEAAWRELEDEAGETLLVTTGGLYAGRWAEECAEALAACGSSCEWLTAPAAAERFPMMSFEGLGRVLWQGNGGVCLAERAVAAQVRVAGAAGVDVRPETPALRLRLAGDGVEVETAVGAIRAGVCVVAAGSYARPLFAQVGIEVPLEPVFAQVTYFEVSGDATITPPGFVEAASVDTGLAEGGYWVPSVDDSAVIKAGDGAAGAPIDPDDAPLAVDPEEEGWVSDFVRRHLPAYDARPVRSETCIYTMTPDGDFVLDRRGPIVVASPCSGHGFKFGPLLGEILADLVTGQDGNPASAFRARSFRAMMDVVSVTERAPFEHTVSSVEELREIYGDPSGVAKDKIIDRLDPHCHDFIARSPFMLLSTADTDGRCDVSPRGGPAGFVEVLDEKRLVFADAKGNKLVDSLRNIAVTGRAGLLFLIPGLDETLRVNGRAYLTRDPEILDRHVIQENRPPRLAVGIEVEEAFLHCAKAFIRSDIWDPASWTTLDGLARPAQIWKDHAKLSTMPIGEIEDMLVEAYANELYWEPAEKPDP